MSKVTRFYQFKTQPMELSAVQEGHYFIRW